MTLILPQKKITAETNVKFMAILSPKIKIFQLNFSWQNHLTAKLYSPQNITDTYFATKKNATELIPKFIPSLNLN